VVAVVVAVDGGGPSTQAATFTKADLPDLVFPDDDPPGALRLDASEPFTTGNAQGYGNKFVPLKGSAKPYWYAASTAAVFEDEGAAQSALDSDKGSKQGENFEPISARGLGDDGFAVFVTGLPRPKNFEGSWKGSDYHYEWRIGNLVQVFDLSLSGPGVSEATARGFANTMEALTE